MSVIRRLRADERGATLIIVTLVMVVLMGFAAFAVDAAAARSQRRENQGAVDTAALSAIQLTSGKLQAVAIADATAEVARISYRSIEPDMTVAEWDAAWAACIDADKPASFTLSGASDCVSFDSGLHRMRVRLPAIDVETTFGRVLGRTVISTNGVAVVEVNLAPGAGAILPFGLPGNAAGDAHVCLKTGPNPQSDDPCDGPDTGNFSFLDITQFGYDPYGTSTVCNGNTNGRLSRNIAQGVDHALSTAPSPMVSDWLDRALCTNGNFSARPYTLTTETGNGKGGALMDGLVNGVAGYPGRIAQGSTTVTVAGEDIDDTPLWSFLSTNGQTVCGAITTHDDMVTCLENWTAGDGVLFRDDLAAAVRFAWVPLFWDATLGNGSSDHHIRQFSPVYLQTTFWKCNAGGCKYVHDPGETLVVNPGNGNNSTVEALTGIQLPLGALPVSIAVDGNPASAGALVYTLVE